MTTCYPRTGIPFLPGPNTMSGTGFFERCMILLCRCHGLAVGVYIVILLLGHAKTSKWHLFPQQMPPILYGLPSHMAQVSGLLYHSLNLSSLGLSITVYDSLSCHPINGLKQYFQVRYIPNPGDLPGTRLLSSSGEIEVLSFILEGIFQPIPDH